MSLPSEIRVARLFISAGHNYFGHHQRPAGEHAIVECPEIHCVAGRGVEGDRFFGHQNDYKGQITFFAAEVFEEVCRVLFISGKSPGVTRRNVITEGADLNAFISKEFTVQGIRFEGFEECRPCYWMDQAIGPGAEAALRGRGGLRARILTDGRLARGRAS